MSMVAAHNFPSFRSIYADPFEPYLGVPSVVISLDGLDESGELIYTGIDLGVFEDPDGDGEYTVKEGKVRRFITTHTTMTIDLGSPSDYTKGVLHKIAYRTLYLPAGTNPDTIIIADYDNGKEGWIPIEMLFKPTYFGNKSDNPFIIHTTQWEANRQTYNDAKIAAGLTEETRPPSTFWSGENLIIQIEATEVVEQIDITILNETSSTTGQPYKVSLTEYVDNPAVSEGAIYTGELWDPDMVNKWGGQTPEELQVKMEVVSGSGIDAEILETLIHTITMDNTELFFRHYKAY